MYVAYVGITGDLKSRINQHLVRRDSSVTTGTTATQLNPDYITEVRWWVDDSFEEKVGREAAEIVALEVLDPALRSRGHASADAQQRAEEPEFRDRMDSLFNQQPVGSVAVPSMKTMLERLAQLEARVAELEQR